MSRDINPFGLRMPRELREQLEVAASQSGRSLNSEIVYRLERSFQQGAQTSVAKDSALMAFFHAQAVLELATRDLQDAEHRLYDAEQKKSTRPEIMKLKRDLKTRHDRVMTMQMIVTRAESEMRAAEQEGGTDTAKP